MIRSRRRSAAAAAGCILITLCGFAAPAAAQTFATSAFAVPVDLPPCDAARPDVAIIDSVADWAQVNDPALRVFCVRPGSYRSAGPIRLERSGTAEAPRVLRYDGPAADRHPVAQTSSERATIQALELWEVSHWIVDGLAVRRAEGYAVRFEEAHHNVVNRLLVERGEQSLVRFRGTSSQNVLQNSVIRRAPIAYGTDHGCVLFDDPGVGRRQKENRLVQNEISDCTDGIQLYTPDAATEGGTFTGLVIDENDIYLSRGRRTNCLGKLDPAGPCACAEEGIDVKLGGAGPAAERRVTISNNRIWGWLEGDRGTDGSKNDPCGGTGSWGGGIQLHRLARHVAIHGNRLLEEPRGVTLGLTSSQASVRENLFHEIDGGQAQKATVVSAGGTDHTVTRNKVVESGNWMGLTNGAQRLDATCNVVVASGGVGGPGDGSGVDANAYHASPRGLSVGEHDVVFSGLESAGEDLCFVRRRWTAPETVCIPHAGPGGLGPLQAQCGAAPAAPRLVP